MPKTSTEVRAWIDEAIRRVEADANRSADTHLHELPVATPDVDLYLKDESVHPTGSLKHRLARSLFLHALCNGWIGPGSTVVEASSGSTAVSEAYFARLVGLRFVAVMPAATSAEKVALIEWYGGRCHFVENAADVYDEARRVAEECDGHYMDQFTYAERATDWRGNNNIAECRYLRYRRHPTSLLVADPENSAFLDGWEQDTSDVVTGVSSRIEGIGRPRVEPSFVGGVIDDMLRVPDAASIATMRWTSDRLGRLVGGSTGTNVWASLTVATRMRAAGESGSIVTLLCDAGERYLSSYYDDAWLAQRGIDLAPWTQRLAEYDATGLLPDVV